MFSRTEDTTPLFFSTNTVVLFCSAQESFVKTLSGSGLDWVPPRTSPGGNDRPFRTSSSHLQNGCRCTKGQRSHFYLILNWIWCVTWSWTLFTATTKQQQDWKVWRDSEEPKNFQITDSLLQQLHVMEGLSSGWELRAHRPLTLAT